MRTVQVTIGSERATIHHEGGVGFDVNVKGVGWVVNDNPSPVFERIATEIRVALRPDGIYCEFCGDGPQCGNCGRGLVPLTSAPRASR